MPLGEHAANAARTLAADPVLRPNEVKVTTGAEDGNLRVEIAGVSVRAIRVAANNVIESLKTIVECLEVFAHDANAEEKK